MDRRDETSPAAWCVRTVETPVTTKRPTGTQIGRVVALPGTELPSYSHTVSLGSRTRAGRWQGLALPVPGGHPIVGRQFIAGVDSPPDVCPSGTVGTGGRFPVPVRSHSNWLLHTYFGRSLGACPGIPRDRLDNVAWCFTRDDNSDDSHEKNTDG